MNDCLSPQERKLLEDTHAKIDRYGHTVIGVMDADVPFAYTVGLTEQGRSELFIAGLPLHVAGDVLNAVAENDVLPGQRLRGILAGGYDLLVQECDVHDAHMYLAGALYDTEATALQLIWPDRDGRYPGNPGYGLPPELQPTHPVRS